VPRGLLKCGIVALALVVPGVTHAATPPPPKPPPIGELPKGPRTTCTMKGPGWILYGVHTPNGPPRHGDRYAVHAWGITCLKARVLLKAFFPKLPAHPMGKLKGGPAGYQCKGIDDPGTVTKSKPHDGVCRRAHPAATFDWVPIGGRVG
jgi:hypothetical protein